MQTGVNIFSLQGKNALVTGATGHLGQSIALILAQAGAHVLINSRSQERCDNMVAKLLDANLSAQAAVFDITDESATTSFFNSFSQPLHILVNNAYAGKAGTIEHQTSATNYFESYDACVVATHRITTAALRHLRKAVHHENDASIINIASMYGLVSPDPRVYDTPQSANPPFYGAAKAALLQWTRYAACEFAKEKIRVNAIAPGAFPSASTQQSQPDFIKRLEQKVPLGRIGHPQELQSSILYLASSASSYVTGSTLCVDGGWTSW